MKKQVSEVRQIITIALALAVIMALTGVVDAMGLFSPGPTTGQRTNFASPVASPMSPPIASPVVTTGDSSKIIADPASTRFPVMGNAFHLLEPGTPGKLSVVAHGPIADGLQIPIVLRNNTAEPITTIVVRVESRDASGNLLGSAGLTVIHPEIIDPGALAIATVFAQQPIPEGGTLRFYPKGTSDPYATRVHARLWGIELTEFAAWPERLEGTLRNRGDGPITSGSLHVACFDASGTLVASPYMGLFPIPALGPGESIDFEVATPPCAFFLFTGTGK